MYAKWLHSQGKLQINVIINVLLQKYSSIWEAVITSDEYPSRSCREVFHIASMHALSICENEPLRGSVLFLLLGFHVQ